MDDSTYTELINEIESDIRKNQSQELYEHSIGTRDYALKLAEKHKLGIDKEKIILAALLHDFAKEYKEQRLFKIAGEIGYIFDDIELDNPYLLHGEIGAYEARRFYGIEDNEILQAIKSHTTGFQNMSDLDLLIFLSDKLERNRHYKDVDKLRKSVEQDFLKGAIDVFEHHKNNVLEKKQKLHPRTILAVEALKKRTTPKIRVIMPRWLNLNFEQDPSRRRNLTHFILTMDGFIVICSLISVIVTFLGSIIFGLYFMYSTIGNEGNNPIGFMRRAQPSTFFQNRKELLFLVAGLDGIHDYERTDTLMLVKLNFVYKSVKITSIPRDMLVKIPSKRGGFWDRVNTAYPIGKEPLLLDTIANLIGYYPDYSVLINLDGFKTIVDIVGGVEIDVEKDMDYDDYAGKLHIHLKKGLQVLNGEDALGYVRYRKDVDGDFSRVRRQQIFLTAFKHRLISPATAFKIDDIIRTIMANVKVTAVLPGMEEPVLVDNGISFQQYLVLGKMMKSLPDGNISSNTLTMRNDGVNYHGMSVQILDYPEFDKTMEEFLSP